MTHYDSTGNIIQVNDRVRYRGEDYTIDTFLETKGALGTSQIKFKETQHIPEIADEISVDKI